jgi:hypothetical protein
MKVINIRRKLAASLVAGGLFVPAVSPAADLNTNLITDPGFESIDDFDVGPFQSVRLLDWPDSEIDGDFLDDNFAYAYSLNYAGSNPSPEAGLYHFTGGFNTTAGDALIQQSIDISTGETGTLVPTGSAFYRLSGYFTSYRDQDDASGLRARFFDSNDAELGVAEIGGMEFVLSLPISQAPIANQRDWGLDTGFGPIPAGTRSVQIEVFSDDTDTNTDGYVDLVDFRVGNISDFVLVLQVNTAKGEATLSNGTGSPVEIDYYEIESTAGALDASGWNSLQDQDFAGTGGGAAEGDYNASGQVEQADLDLVLLNWGQATPPPPAGWTNDLPSGNVDQAELDGVLLNWGNTGGAGAGEGWEEAGGVDAGLLSESFLLGSSTLEDGAEVDLGMLYNTVIGGEDLVFRYGLESGELVTGFVDYVSAGGAAAVPEPASFCLIVGCAALAGGLIRNRGATNN